MHKYEYICPKCSHTYTERREVGQPQIITKCNGCGNSEYTPIEPTE